MKSFVTVVFCTVFSLLITPVMSAQSDNSPRKLLEALAKRDYRHATELAKTVDNPDYSDKSGATLLMCAAETGAKEVCRVLIERGADCNMKSANGTTALYVASQNGHTEVVRLLLGKGAATDLRSDNGATPLIAASQFGYTEIVSLLAEGGGCH